MKKDIKPTSDREFAVVLEKVYGEIKVLAEGQALISDKLDSTMGMVAKIAEDNTMLNMRFSVAEGGQTKILGKLAKIEDDLGFFKANVNSRFTALEAKS